MFQIISKHVVTMPESWQIDDNYLYYSDGEKIIKKSIGNDGDALQITLTDTIYKLLLYRDEIIAFFSSRAKRVLRDNLFLISDASFESRKFLQEKPSDNKIFGKVGDGINVKRKTFLYDIYQGVDIWMTDRRLNPVTIGNYGFSNLVNKLERFDFTTGEILWSQSIEELGKYFSKSDSKWNDGQIDRILGVYNGLVWVCLNNGLFVAANIETSAIKYQVGAPNQYPFELYMMEETKEQNFFYNHHSIFDEKYGKIIRLWHAGYSNEGFNWLFETDLKANEPELSISKVENSTGIPFIIDGNPCPVWPFDDDFIYVCNYREYKIALFNRSTKRIEWVHEIEVEPSTRSFIIKMEVQGNRWYVLDNSRTLFVFERE